MAKLVGLLRSPGLTRVVLLYLAVYTAAAAWLPWVRGRGAAPRWAIASGLDQPFSAAPFLAGCAALFATTLACTWGRRARIARIWRGELPPGATALPARAGRAVEPFLRAHGFSGSGPTLSRMRIALWGGWVLHVGLLVLIAGIIVQQAVYDSGSFQLGEGEGYQLSDAGALFTRHKGVLAPAEPPDVGVALERFEPFAKQEGYARDRLSTVLVREGRGPPRRATLDRAAGVDVGGATVYQAIPTGLVVKLELEHAVRSLYMPMSHDDPWRPPGSTRSQAAFLDAAGRPVRVAVETERRLLDPAGLGKVTVSVEQNGRLVPVEEGAELSFGGERARLIGVSRWGGFTYARNPGMPIVLLGFVLVLGGAAVLAFPAGVAQLATTGDDGVAARVFVTRGVEALARSWVGEGPEAPN